MCCKLNHTHSRIRCATLGGMLAVGLGCAGPRITRSGSGAPNVAPTSQPTSVAPLRLETSEIKPLYREILAIDLPAAIRAAMADNLDIQRARQEVEASRGRLESSIGGAFPAVVPSAVFQHVEGTTANSQGQLVGAGFSTFQPSVAVQWITNPGHVVYQIIAARKQLSASEHQEDAVIIETLRLAAVQYYELVLAQTRVATASQAVVEAAELLRINQTRLRTGSGVPADVLRAEAQLAAFQQDLLIGIDAFYQASVALAVTLRLDSSVTLVPRISELPATTLVRADLSLDELLGLAAMYRPDLKSVRELVQAAVADRGATWWGAFGPQFQVGYQIGGITGHAADAVPAQGIPGNLIVNPLSTTGSFNPNPMVNGVIKEGIMRLSARAAHSHDKTYAFSEQQQFGADAAWRLSLSAFGDLRTATAVERQTIVDAERQLDLVRAQVVGDLQNSKTSYALIGLAEQQVRAAEESLRLTQANLQAGTMTTLDVLQAEDAATQARLRRAEAVVRYNQAQVNLLAALGLLDGRQLAAPNVK
jgi:outer membrane protein TolC